MPYAELFGGLVYLLLGGDLIVRGAVALARRLHVPPMVVGLTVVALGTSAPELVVAIQAALEGVPALALGNVVGSNIANILLVLGVPALFVPLSTDQPTLARDAFVMVGVSLAFVALCALGPLGRTDGALLMVGLVAFVVWTARQNRGEPREDDVMIDRPLGVPRTLRTTLLLLGLGVVFLPLGGELLVSGAVAIATRLGVPEVVIGLTVIAVGTSLPELATSVVAAGRGQIDVAMGNVLGSNILNLLAIGGAAARVSPRPIEVPTLFLLFDLPVMLLCAGVALLLARRGGYVGARTGGMLLLGYGAYLALLAVLN